MEGVSEVHGKRKNTRPPRGAAVDSFTRSLPSLKIRRKAVQLYLEEGFPPELVARETAQRFESQPHERGNDRW
ncbi:MAG: hypothetical protein LAO31_20875 [Acidobacteriia bacterium]|nr:hypothetical protein [Terriglobia bacterium]